MTDDNDNTGSNLEETLAYHKAVLKKMSWISPKRKASVLPLASLGRRIQKIVRTLSPHKPTLLKLGPNSQVVFITPDQYKSIQMLKRTFDRIVAEEEKCIASNGSEVGEHEPTE